MKLNSNSTNNIKKSKEKNKIFNFENINNNNKINNNSNNHKIKIENQNSSFNNSIKNIWSQLNEKKKYINLKDKVFSKSKSSKLIIKLPYFTKKENSNSPNFSNYIFSLNTNKKENFILKKNTFSNYQISNNKLIKTFPKNKRNVLVYNKIFSNFNNNINNGKNISHHNINNLSYNISNNNQNNDLINSNNINSNYNNFIKENTEKTNSNLDKNNHKLINSTSYGIINKINNIKIPIDINNNNNNNNYNNTNINNNFDIINNHLLHLKENNKNSTSRKKKFYLVKKVLKNYQTFSLPGTNENGESKINQDTLLILFNICDIKDFNVFGILDGHGLNGELVSDFVSKNIISQINKIFIDFKNKTFKDIYHKLINNKYKLIIDIFHNAEKDLFKAEFNCELSGTTCNLLFQIGKKIICANTGDSRTLLIYQNIFNNNFEYYNLSNDFKPTIKSEKKRIEKMGGEVKKEPEYGIDKPIYRVYVKDECYPGLAMSRSIGDLIASKIGVISDPEIKEYTILDNTKYIIMGSDGIWDVYGKNELVEESKKYYLNSNCENMCENIVNKARELWIKNEKATDDISMIALFF